jgi:SOS regulatory protein LexA
MADFLGVKALSTVHQHLEALRSKGFIEKSPDRERNVTALKSQNTPRLVEIPLLGEIAAGLPLMAIEDERPVYISTELAPDAKDHYALRVRGNSMIGDGIQDEDVIVVKAQQFPSYTGQIVVAVVKNEATLKRFGGVTPDGLIKLIPKNPDVPTIYADPSSFEIRGVFKGLIRGI